MRRVWWGLGGLLALVLVPAAAAGVFVLRLDPNDYKPALVAAVRDATGRRLAINGDLRLSRSLWPTLEANDVTLANLPGGSRADMARAERITVELSLPALLRHRIEVVRLGLVGPNILFEVVNGKPNWRLDLAGDDAPAPASVSAGTPFTLGIRDTHVQNGMVTWNLQGRTRVLGIRTMDVQHHSEGGPLQFGGTYLYADNQPFQLTATATPTAGLAGPWATRLDVTAFDTVASATGTMDTAGAYDMQLEAEIGTLDKLNALLPALRLPPAHKVRLSSRLTNGRRPGTAPVIGASHLTLADADLAGMVPGLRLGAFDLAIDKPGGTATVKGTGVYAGQGFALSGTTGLPPHLEDKATVAVDLVAKALPPGTAAGSAGLSGKVVLDHLDYAGLDATASLATPAMAGLRPLLGAALPALTDVQLRGRVVLPAHPATVAFSAARLSSRQGDLEGSGSVGLGGGPVLSGRLHAGALDLDAMLQAFGIDLSAPASAPGRYVIPDAPLAWHVLRGPTLDLVLGVDQLRFMAESWAGVELGLVLKAGRLDRFALQLAGTGGPTTATMTADATVAAVPVELAIDAPALPLALVARYAGLPGRVGGTARAQARLRGSGNSLHALAATLDGTVSLAAVGGQMSNAAFIAMTGASLQALGTRVPAQGETAIRCLGVAASFRGGVGTVNPVALETTYLSLAGTGLVDLGQERLTFNLRPMASVSGSAVAVPVLVEGPFRSLSGRLDADLVDKLGLALDGLFGGDKDTACADAGLLPPKAR